MTKIICHLDSCKYNKGGVCQKDAIEFSVHFGFEIQEHMLECYDEEKNERK